MEKGGFQRALGPCWQVLQLRRIANVTVFTPKALVGVPMTETGASGNPLADSMYAYKLSSEQEHLLT